MKVSEQWLREWVNPQATIHEIADRLLMGGLELEIEPAVEQLPPEDGDNAALWEKLDDTFYAYWGSMPYEMPG